MRKPGITRPLLEGARGQIIRLLRRRPRSVKDLLVDLDITENAIRSQLSKLEAYGLVERAGKRPGVRKPEDLYRLTPEAEHLFPKAYGRLLRQLMDVLGERMEEDNLLATLDEVALRLSTELAQSPGGDLMEQVEKGAEVVETLGGAADVERSNDTLKIRGWSCPFAEVSPWHPELCHAVEILLSQVTGLTLREHCDREPPAPRCAFSIEAGRA